MIHPNTREDTVREYLAKFGRLVTNKVIYGVFPEGPLKCMENGDRSYKMVLKSCPKIGSYHVLDGLRVTLHESKSPFLNVFLLKSQISSNSLSDSYKTIFANLT